MFLLLKCLIGSWHFCRTIANFLLAGNVFLVGAVGNLRSVVKGRQGVLWWCILGGAVGWRWILFVLKGETVSSRYAWGAILLLLIFSAAGWTFYLRLFRRFLPNRNWDRNVRLLIGLGLVVAVIGVGMAKTFRSPERSYLYELVGFFEQRNRSNVVLWELSDDFKRVRELLPDLKFTTFSSYPTLDFWRELHEAMTENQFSERECYLFLRLPLADPGEFEREFRHEWRFFPFRIEREWDFRSSRMILYRYLPEQDGLRRPISGTRTLQRTVDFSRPVILKYRDLFADGTIPAGVHIRSLRGDGTGYDDFWVRKDASPPQDGVLTCPIELQNDFGWSLGRWNVLLSAQPEGSLEFIELPAPEQSGCFEPEIYPLPKRIAVGDSGWRIQFAELINATAWEEWEFELEYAGAEPRRWRGSPTAAGEIQDREIPAEGLAVTIRCRRADGYEKQLDTFLYRRKDGLPSGGTVLVLSGRNLQYRGWIADFQKSVPGDWNFIRNAGVASNADFEGGFFVSYLGLWRDPNFHNVAEPNRFLDWNRQFQFSRFVAEQGIRNLDVVILLLGAEEVIRSDMSRQFSVDLPAAVAGICRQILAVFPNCRIVVAGVPRPPANQTEWLAQTGKERSAAFWWLRRHVHWRFIQLLLESIPEDARVAFLPLYAEWKPEWYKTRKDRNVDYQGSDWELTPEGYQYLFQRISNSL